MKVLVNGGLNLSELDGWWSEAYTSDVGWALGDGAEHREAGWDAVEAWQLYELVERQVVPEFYERHEDRLPRAWLRRVRQGLGQRAPRFSTNRMLPEYVAKVYEPAVERLSRRSRHDAKLATELNALQSAIRSEFSNIRFGNLTVQRHESEHCFRVEVDLAGLSPEFVKAELYADAAGAWEVVRLPMVRDSLPSERGPLEIYEASIGGTLPPEHFTPTIIPHHENALVPLKEGHILWFR